jgi:hypothetical protein
MFLTSLVFLSVYHKARKNKILFYKGDGAVPDGNKQKFALWIYSDTQKRVDQLYKSDNCKSRSEFIEKAIKFYCGYVLVENALEFLPTAITSAVSGAVNFGVEA